MTIHSCSNEFNVRNIAVTCHRELRRISCLLVDTCKMDQILIKQSRDKMNPSDIFFISLQMKKNVETIQIDFGGQFDKQLKDLITEFADVAEESEGLPTHRIMLDHKVKLIGYPPR